MIDRRNFLHNTMSLGLSTATGHVAAAATGGTANNKDLAHEFQPTEYERLFAKVKDLWPLGVPRSWSMVREGLHPVSPERIITLNAAACSDPIWQHKALKDRLQEKIRGYGWCKGQMPYATKKLSVIMRMVERLAAYYQPDYYEDWATRMATREALASTGISHGFGLLHDFQGFDQRVKTVNRPVDWWLVQFPDGFAWGSLDDQPVFLMLGPVAAEGSKGNYLSVLEAISKTLRAVSTDETRRGLPAKIRQIANMDRVTAARTLNWQVALSIVPCSQTESAPTRGKNAQ